MFKIIREFCIRFPWIVLAVVLLITGGAIYQMKHHLYFEGDVTKFLPKDLKAVKANDYSQKNFYYQERVLIGVEYPQGSILEPSILRAIEEIVLGLKDLKAEKTFDSLLTGKTETLVMPVGIDTEDINSIANLEDTILDQETGSVIAGSVIEKLKQDQGIASQPGMEERLPPSESDLLKIIPALRQRIINDRIFLGNVLSEDEQAGNIQVPMIRKWDYKNRFSELELTTALDPQALKNRFSGNDTMFPFTVYGKTYDGITINDEYIRQHSDTVARKIRAFFIDNLKPVFEQHPQLEELLTGRMSAQKLTALMRLTRDRDFFLDPQLLGWDQFTNNLYEYTLDIIDPLSRENLEFKLFDVKDIYNLKVNYELITNLVDAYQIPGLKIHIAGQPVTVALISYMMQADMKRMVPIAVLIVFVVLILSFRSVAGLVIPLLTVVFAVFWSMGLMAVFGVPLSITTTSMPIVLLAVGTAYGIHLLNRYFMEIKTSGDQHSAIETTYKQIGPAVVMAGVTTIAGFGSLNFSTLPSIRHFGIFSAAGVLIALLLSFTLAPAILNILKTGVKKRKNAAPTEQEKPQANPSRPPSWPGFIANHPKSSLLVFVAITGLAITGALRNYFEGDPIINFKQDNPLYQADQFINTSTTGTNMINLIFKFRDQVNLESDEIQTELKQRVTRFDQNWKAYLSRIKHGDTNRLFAIGDNLQAMVATQPLNPVTLEKRLQLIQDLLNEDYTVEETDLSGTAGASPAGEADEELSAEEGLSGDDLVDLLENSSDGLDDLSGLGKETTQSEDDQAEGMDAGQLAGINDIIARLNLSDVDPEAMVQSIVNVRAQKGNTAGLQMQRSFNQLLDLLVTDVKQPIVLHKLETLYTFLQQLEQPVVVKGTKELAPTGLVVSPVDLIRKVYKTFYHDDNLAFDRLPDTTRDGIADITLTDRSIIGVAVNQAQSSNREMFESMVTPDYKEFQMQVMIRSGSNQIIEEYERLAFEEISRLFPKDDPYVERMLIGGLAPQLRQVTGLLMDSQLKSIAGSCLLVWLVTFFIFRSAMGGLFSLVPLVFTVIANFGVMYAVGWPITQGTVIVASIAIGIGIDYTIHFLERFKRQIQEGDSLGDAYTNTIQSCGRAIAINALSVALGFSVLVFSDFIPVIALGVLMMGTMIFSTLGALILLPTLILITKPNFINKALKAQ